MLPGLDARPLKKEFKRYVIRCFPPFMQLFLAALTAAAARLILGVAPRAARIDVASVAGVVDLTANAPNTDDIRITGALAITGFTVATDRVLRVTAGGAFTLTNGAGLVTQTGANIVAAAGDTFMLRATAANVVEVLNYVAVAGPANAVLLTGNQTIAGVKTFGSQPVVPAQSLIRLANANAYGGTNVKIRRFSTVVSTQGTDITYTDSAANGASFTINANGVYAIVYADCGSGAMDMGLSLNSTQLTTNIQAITIADILCETTTQGGALGAVVSFTGYLAAGSVVRAHTDGGAVGSRPVTFVISRVS